MTRKKLIEVALPLEAINEDSPVRNRHGAASRHQPGLAAAIAALQQVKMEPGQM